MTKNFYQRMTLDDGTETTVHVNRRGCKGRWNKKDGEMLQALVQALHTMTPEELRKVSPPDVPATENR